MKESKDKRKRNVTQSSKKSIAGKQKYKCANNPNSQIKINGLENYNCPLWINNGDGSFDESGYEIDHIIEHSIGGADDNDNLQALCLMCHKVKTKRFLQNRNRKNENENENNNNNNNIVTQNENNNNADNTQIDDDEEYIRASEFTEFCNEIAKKVGDLKKELSDEKKQVKILNEQLIFERTRYDIVREKYISVINILKTKSNCHVADIYDILMKIFDEN